jgi:4'-phosphopantetheinyl transferase
MTRRLRSGEVHVFVVWLSSRLRHGTLLRGLSRVERKVSRTFMNVQARIEYIASRFCMRLLASKYLGIGRCEIELRKTETGQPQLVSLRGARAHHLNISLSHCVRGVAIAFAHKTRIGVDLEMHRPLVATKAMARWLIGAERSLVEPRQMLDCWTRKEALLKGLGLGLFGLASAPPLEHRTNVATAGAAVWTVDSISVAPDCSLACAAESVQRRIRLFTFRSCTTINRSF